MITRKIKHELMECAAEYPAVTILGPRQSGKTTLAKMVFSRRPHISLEDPDIRRQATDDPRGLLEELQEGAILDKIQRVPHLLIMEVVKNILNQGKEPQLYFFRDSKGNEVDLLISSAGRSFTAIEIKSAATFQPEFIKGIDVFKHSVGGDISVQSLVWYNGQRKTTYQNTAVSNPLLHGFSVS